MGTPPGFQKLKHVLEIPFCCAEENSDYVFLMTNDTEVLVVYLRDVPSQKHFETNFLLKFLFILGCCASENKSVYTTEKETGCQRRENEIHVFPLSELLTAWVINKSLQS